MKKSLLALAALTAFAGVASAQSSVTLFGVVDLSLRSAKNPAGTIQSLASGNNATSRLGFRGVEDLGGGLRAGFWIEGQLDPDTGGTGQNWQRRSTVSLMGGFGEMRLGRDYTPSFWNKAVFDPFGYVGIGAVSTTMSTLGSGATTLVRANNTVGYFLPAMGGIFGQAMVAAGEGVPGNKYMGGRLGYAAGPINVAMAYGKTARDGAMVDAFTDLNFGGSFKLGMVTLVGQYNKVDYSTASQKVALVGVLMPMGKGTFKASYVKASGSAANLEASQIALGYVYDLSKRTALYTTYARLDNGGAGATGARFATPGGPVIAASRPGGFTTSGYEFGVRHSF